MLGIYYKIVWLVLFESWLVLFNAFESDSSRCTADGVQCQHGVCELHKASDGTNIELCKCNRYYSGRLCEFADSACTRFNCKHGSYCDLDDCVCSEPDIQTGEDCSEIHCSVDGEVMENYCKNGGVCHSGQCICPNHTTGAHCELSICGEYLCTDGYCMLDRCECDTACIIGCDETTGSCKTQSGMVGDSKISPTMKIVMIVVGVVVFVVIIPGIYAMYKMKLENETRNERLRSHYEMEKRYQELYLAKSQNYDGASKAASKERSTVGAKNETETDTPTAEPTTTPTATNSIEKLGNPETDKLVAPELNENSKRNSLQADSQAADTNETKKKNSKPSENQPAVTGNANTDAAAPMHTIVQLHINSPETADKKNTQAPTTTNPLTNQTAPTSKKKEKRRKRRKRRRFY